MINGDVMTLAILMIRRRMKIRRLVYMGVFGWQSRRIPLIRDEKLPLLIVFLYCFLGSVLMYVGLRY